MLLSGDDSVCDATGIRRSIDRRSVQVDVRLVHAQVRDAEAIGDS